MFFYISSIVPWSVVPWSVNLAEESTLGSRTEIQGGPGGPWPPQKFSIVVAVNLSLFIY